MRRHKTSSVAVGAILVALLAVTALMLFWSQMKEKERIELEEQYQVINQALGWPSFDVTIKPVFWYTEADPTDPNGYMLQTLLAVKSENYTLALELTRECIKWCEASSNEVLEKDAHYLLGVIMYRQALYESRSPGQVQLHDEARGAIEEGKGSDTGLEEHLVWRHEDAYNDPPKDALWYLRPVRINIRHPVLQMHEGLTLFHYLFKGGDRKDFQKAVDHFQAVVDKQPQNFSALTFLGRMQFFYARFYNYLHLLEDAEKNIRRAIRCEGDHPYPLTYTTLGQILEFQGDHDQAMEFYKKAYRLGKGRDPNFQNTLCGMGTIFRFSKMASSSEPIMLITISWMTLMTCSRLRLS